MLKVRLDQFAPQLRDDLASGREPIVGSAALEADSHPDRGKQRPSANAIRTARRVLDDLTILYAGQFGEKALPCSASPLPTGVVLLEWREPTAGLEVEVDAKGRLAFLLQRRRGAAAEFEAGEDTSLEDAAALLAQVLPS